MKSVSNRMKLLRNEQQFTQKQVAEATGIKEDDYKNYEQNKANPSIDSLIAIAEFYQVSLDFLLELTESRISNYGQGQRVPFSQKIGELRNKCFLSTQQLTDELGLSRRMIAYYEEGKKAPSLETLIKIAQFFEVTVDEMVGRY